MTPTERVLIGAAQGLLNKIAEIEKHPAYYEVYRMASACGKPYTGPNYAQELAALDHAVRVVLSAHEKNPLLDEIPMTASTVITSFQSPEEKIRRLKDAIVGLVESHNVATRELARVGKERDRARRTLLRAGYTLVEGAEEWKPPLGKKPPWVDLEMKCAVCGYRDRWISTAEAAVLICTVCGHPQREAR